MSASQIHLELVDAAELAEALTFISQWLAGPDHPQLEASFRRFMGVDGYDLTELRTDLARFTFLLGHDDGEQLFGTGQPPLPGSDNPATDTAGRTDPVAVQRLRR